MKKIVMTLVAAIAMTSATFAETNTEVNVKAAQETAYDLNHNSRRLAVYLGLSFDQMESVEVISNDFCNAMNKASKAKANQRKELTDKAIKSHLGYMKFVLTDQQYRQYLLLLNTTLNNRGMEF